jgi:predicted ATPase/DNA-binding winged helix-turn-helix (wHTH) protein
VAEFYSFGRFAVDPSERRLYVDGVLVPIGSTDIRLLLTLLENPGHTVAKGDLITRVWGRAVVTDNALYVHINALRKILGDDCIVNKQGSGYRFVAPVRKAESRVRHAGAKVRTGNLPLLWMSNATAGPTRLIGRAERLRLLSNLLAQGRLVTLTGSAGVGKTRLVLQAASEASPDFCDGVWLVELAPLNDPDLAAAAIASALGVRIGASVTSLDALVRYLARKSLLIVLDNCEHVIEAAAQVSEALLAASPGVKILATSREPLSCSGEQVMEVPPLAVPAEGAMNPEIMRSVAAVDLFMERALGSDVDFRIEDKDLATVARICRRVDGLPLAIEMVAGWAGMLGLEMLDAKLDGSLRDWLRARSTAPPRHSTLRAALEWSHALLSAAEQSVLCRLAVFAGGFTIRAAEAVAGGDRIPRSQIFGHVANLIRKSMIAVMPGSQMQRYRLLETTRAFMLEELAASGEGNATRQRHARHVLSVLEEAMHEWETTSDAVWLEQYGSLLDDVRAALEWAMGDDSDDAVALAGASWPLWRELSLRTEGIQRLSAAAARLRPDTPPALEARLRRGLGEMLLNTAAINSAHEEIERAAILYRRTGHSACLGSALSTLGYTLLLLDRTEEAEQANLEAVTLLEPSGWVRALAIAYSMQLCIMATLGHFDAARTAQEKAARLSGMAGHDRTALVVSANLVQLTFERGDVDGAVSAGRSMTEQLRDTTHSGLYGFVLGVLAAALTARGDLNEAMTVAREAVPLLRDDGALFWLFDHLALRAALGGRAKDSALIAGYANLVSRNNGQREPMGRHAVERTAVLLRQALPEEEIEQLGRLGAHLSEEQALTIALSG